MLASLVVPVPDAIVEGIDGAYGEDTDERPCDDGERGIQRNTSIYGDEWMVVDDDDFDISSSSGVPSGISLSLGLFSVSFSGLLSRASRSNGFGDGMFCR